MKYRTWVNEPLGPTVARRELLGRDGGRRLDDPQEAAGTESQGYHNISIGGCSGRNSVYTGPTVCSCVATEK